MRIVRPLFFFLVALTACQGTPEPAPRKPLRDFRGIIHCHSKFSHDSKGTYEEILAAAKAAKVDFICMTDHPPSDDKGRPLREGWTGIHDGVLFIQGAEYSDQILGLGLKEPISGKDRRGTIKAIHEQGGVAIACHPELIENWDEYEEADGMEIFNVHATFARKLKEKEFLVQMAKMMKEDPEHSFRLLQEPDPAILKRWDEINRKRRFVGIAGNDSHQNVRPFGLQLDPYPRAFRFVTTHVLAEDLTREAILEALRRGRAYVKFEISSRRELDPEGLGWIGWESSVEQLSSPPPARLVMVERDLFSNDSEARWLKDGNDYPMLLVPSAMPPPGFRYLGVAGPGVYRAELRSDGRPWILTNPRTIR